MALDSLESLAGFTIEQKVLEELQSIYSVISTANIQTSGRHGPRLESKQEHTTLADSMIFGERRGWIEIKSKSRAIHYRNWNRDEHGIDHDKFIEYCDLKIKTGMSVYIMICELSTRKILIADVDTLRASGKPRLGKWPDNGKVCINWDRGVFAIAGTFQVDNHDLRRITITWNRDVLKKFLSQLELSLEYYDRR